jgi:hypothetical protein
MDRYIKNSKILFELLPEKDQPKKTALKPHADMMKHALVTDVGSKVEEINIGDIITLYVTTMFMIEKNIGFCSERDVIFTNNIPQKGKVHIHRQSKNPLQPLSNAVVINSNSSDIEKGEKVFYREGQSMQLPDNTEIISETQIYYSQED